MGEKTVKRLSVGIQINLRRKTDTFFGMKKGKQRTPKSIRDYSTMLALVNAVTPLERVHIAQRNRKPGELGRILNSPANMAIRQKVLQSPQYRRLPKALKLEVRNALRGKTTDRRLLVSSTQTVTRAGKILQSKRGKRLRFNQVISLVMQLPARRQKTVLFSMPASGDKFRRDVWKEVQARRSKKHVERVKKTLREIVVRKGKRGRMCERIASQLMTVSPSVRGELLKGFGLSLIDVEQVRTIISAKKQKAMALIAENREQAKWNTAGEMPSVTLPKGLYPIFKAFAASERRKMIEAGEPEKNVWGERYMPTITEFFDMLRKAAVKRERALMNL